MRRAPRRASSSESVAARRARHGPRVRRRWYRARRRRGRVGIPSGLVVRATPRQGTVADGTASLRRKAPARHPRPRRVASRQRRRGDHGAATSAPAGGAPRGGRGRPRRAGARRVCGAQAWISIAAHSDDDVRARQSRRARTRRARQPHLRVAAHVAPRAVEGGARGRRPSRPHGPSVIGPIDASSSTRSAVSQQRRRGAASTRVRTGSRSSARSWGAPSPTAPRERSMTRSPVAANLGPPCRATTSR